MSFPELTRVLIESAEAADWQASFDAIVLYPLSSHVPDVAVLLTASLKVGLVPAGHAAMVAYAHFTKQRQGLSSVHGLLIVVVV